MGTTTITLLDKPGGHKVSHGQLIQVHGAFGKFKPEVKYHDDEWKILDVGEIPAEYTITAGGSAYSTTFFKEPNKWNPPQGYGMIRFSRGKFEHYVKFRDYALT